MLTEFDTFYNENVIPALKIACKYLPLCKAEDVAQNVFFEIWKRWDTIEKKGEYLRRAIKNRCFDELKRISTTSIENIEIEDRKEENILEYQIDAIRAALSKLSPNYRRTVQYIIDGYTNKEISEILSINLQAVRNNKHIAIKSLKQIIHG